MEISANIWEQRPVCITVHIEKIRQITIGNRQHLTIQMIQIQKNLIFLYALVL